MLYVIQVCWQLASRSICSCSQAVSKTLWHIPLLYVHWITPDDGQRNCPKHVEFYFQNKSEKPVHFTIRKLYWLLQTTRMPHLKKNQGFFKLWRCEYDCKSEPAEFINALTLGLGTAIQMSLLSCSWRRKFQRIESLHPSGCTVTPAVFRDAIRWTFSVEHALYLRTLK